MMFLNEELTSDALDLEGFNTDTAEGDAIIEQAILEDALIDCNMKMLDENTMAELLSEELLSERNILKWDKKAKKKYAKNKAVLVIAREKNDRLFKKLITVMKMRRKLLNQLNDKYGTKADARVRQKMNNHNMAKAVSKVQKSKNIHIKGVDLPSGNHK